ncbi:MAG: inositol monophosphatase family protein [Planctomycetota bacterium]
MSRNLPDFFEAVSDEMKLAAKAALAAGEIIAANYQKVHQIDAKGVGDLVSQVDFEADQAATAMIQSASELPIMSEELSPDVEDTQQKMWVVDPLDGTTAYLMGAGPQFSSVLISICDSGVPILGITYFPMTEEWFYATKGGGAFKNGLPLKMKERQYQLRTAWIEMNQYGDVAFETEFFSAARRSLRSTAGALIATSTFPYAGVAMRIAEQSSGLCAAIHDNNPASLKQGPWDIAANQIIFEEAGGVFLNPDLNPISPFVAEPIIVSPTRELADEIRDCAMQRVTH